ncbi:MAG: hypothetical protein MUO50_02330, partial [Longimicrobiales bacterium]|nr:hypothetical protein [Longimicrobiales bacterium]
MIRTFWVFLVGFFSTFFHAGNVVLRVHFWRRNLHCACDKAARRWSQNILWAANVRVNIEGLEN